MGQVSIRKATLDDVEGIRRVCVAGQRDTYATLRQPGETEAIIAEWYSPERISRDIQDTSSWNGYYVAVDADEVVGAGGGALVMPASSEIYVLYLDPNRRGEGVGTLLLNAITAELIAQGACEQWVSVTPNNSKGIPFYKARGFLKKGERTYEDTDTVSWLFWRSIGNAAIADT